MGLVGEQNSGKEGEVRKKAGDIAFQGRKGGVRVKGREDSD